MAPAVRRRQSNLSASTVAPRRSGCWWISTARRTSTKTAACFRTIFVRNTRGTGLASMGRTSFGASFLATKLTRGRMLPSSLLISSTLRPMNKRRPGQPPGLLAPPHQTGAARVRRHLVDADTAEAEVIYPMAMEGTGLQVEREVAIAALGGEPAPDHPREHNWALGQKIEAFAPVLRHISNKCGRLGSPGPLSAENPPDTGLRCPGGGVANGHRKTGSHRQGSPEQLICNIKVYQGSSRVIKGIKETLVPVLTL